MPGGSVISVTTEIAERRRSTSHANPGPPLVFVSVKSGGGTLSTLAPLIKLRDRIGDQRNNQWERSVALLPRRRKKNIPIAKKPGVAYADRMAEEVYPAEMLSDTCLTGQDNVELGPRLKALLLAQPLNPLQRLVFRELPSREGVSPKVCSQNSL
jgi:hypothetical protein